MDYQYEERKPPTWLDNLISVVVGGILLASLVAFVWLILTALVSSVHKTPTFSVESTAVKAYNLTSDNNLITLINLGIRAHNPNPNSIDYYFLLHGIVAKVTKGKGHVLAEQSLPDALLVLTPGSDTVVPVEASGQLPLEREVAEEVRADAVAGEGRVNVHVYSEAAWVAISGGGSCFSVTCEDVVIDFSRSTEKVQRVDCKTRMGLGCREF